MWDHAACDAVCALPLLRVRSALIHAAPEVLLGQQYDGKVADVWSCGVMLYVMLYGHYPAEDTREMVLQNIQIPER